MTHLRNPDECCAFCAKFSRRDQEQADQGNGWCSGYERYVRADDRPSVLFMPAPRHQMGERREFLEKHKEAV